MVQKPFIKLISWFLVLILSFQFAIPVQTVQAQLLTLPAVNGPVNLTPSFSPTIVKGLNLYSDNPLKFDFILEKGDAFGQNDPERVKSVEGFSSSEEVFAFESQKLIKYFLASLTVPQKEMWVNLSPNEPDRIIPNEFGKTEMGRDLLAQDYLLKQLTSSLLNPNDKVGAEFWDKIYQKIYEGRMTKDEGRESASSERSDHHSSIIPRGDLDIPTDIFSKVWIVPETAKLYEHDKGVFIVSTYLKVMTESDYFAEQNNRGDKVTKQQSDKAVGNSVTLSQRTNVSDVTLSLIKTIIIPAIEKEVNEGATFANLRQIYNSMILALWYKKKLNESIRRGDAMPALPAGRHHPINGRVTDSPLENYIDQHKTAGLEYNQGSRREAVESRNSVLQSTTYNLPPNNNLSPEQIYNMYLEAFKKGANDLIKEEYNPETQQIVARKYITGGAKFDAAQIAIETGREAAFDSAALVKDPQQVTFEVSDAALLASREDLEAFVDKLGREKYVVFLNKKVLKTAEINTQFKDLMDLIRTLEELKYSGKILEEDLISFLSFSGMEHQLILEVLPRIFIKSKFSFTTYIWAIRNFFRGDKKEGVILSASDGAMLSAVRVAVMALLLSTAPAANSSLAPNSKPTPIVLENEDDDPLISAFGNLDVDFYENVLLALRNFLDNKPQLKELFYQEVSVLSEEAAKEFGELLSDEDPESPKIMDFFFRKFQEYSADAESAKALKATYEIVVSNSFLTQKKILEQDVLKLNPLIRTQILLLAIQKTNSEKFSAISYWIARKKYLARSLKQLMSPSSQVSNEELVFVFSDFKTTGLMAEVLQSQWDLFFKFAEELSESENLTPERRADITKFLLSLSDEFSRRILLGFVQQRPTPVPFPAATPTPEATPVLENDKKSPSSPTKVKKPAVKDANLIAPDKLTTDAAMTVDEKVNKFMSSLWGKELKMFIQRQVPDRDLTSDDVDTIKGSLIILVIQHERTHSPVDLETLDVITQLPKLFQEVRDLYQRNSLSAASLRGKLAFDNFLAAWEQGVIQLGLKIEIKTNVSRSFRLQLRGVEWDGIIGFDMERFHITKIGASLIESITIIRESADSAQMGQVNNGGIDLNAAQLQVNVDKVGRGFEMTFDPVMFEQIKNAAGLVPVIINIQPIKNLPLFLGLLDKDGEANKVALQLSWLSVMDRKKLV